MNYTNDEFINSLVIATGNGEMKWAQGDYDLHEWLEASYGNCGKLYILKDEESDSDIVYASYQFYEGEEEDDEFIRDGASILFVDIIAGEILREITDEDVEEGLLFEKLVAVIEGQLK